MITSYLISAIRYWIEMKDKNKNGEPIRKPSDVRKILIRGDFATVPLKERSAYKTVDTFGFRATLVKRKGERYISVFGLVKPVRSCWDKTPIKESECQWKKLDNISLDGFEKWLAMIGVQCPAAVVSQMLTCPPVSSEEGQAELDCWERLAA